MNISEANAANTVLVWAMAHATGRAPLTKSGIEITDDMATKAAKLLAVRANQALAAGLTPDEVELRSVDRSHDLAPGADGGDG